MRTAKCYTTYSLRLARILPKVGSWTSDSGPNRPDRRCIREAGDRMGTLPAIRPPCAAPSQFCLVWSAHSTHSGGVLVGVLYVAVRSVGEALPVAWKSHRTPGAEGVTAGNESGQTAEKRRARGGVIGPCLRRRRDSHFGGLVGEREPNCECKSAHTL